MSSVRFSQVGAMGRHAGQPALFTRRGETGWVLYGPYLPVAPGHYIVDFTILAERTMLAATMICCRVDVVREGKVMVAASYTAAQLAALNGVVALSFDVEEEGRHEFRVYTTGKNPLTVLSERRLRLRSGAGAEPARDAVGFAAANAAALRGLEELGFSFAITSQAIVAHYEDVRFFVDNGEDLQVMREIFCDRSYNIDVPHEVLFVDIGMNVGLASLFMAAKPNVRAVHAFEPFAQPYGRALRNVELNPALAGKITAHPFGLSGADEQHRVQVQRGNTIGTSVRGHGEGEEEAITLRDAATVLAPLAERAAAEGLSLVLKVDCEGSEFAIFESLDRAGLFAAVTAIVVEWHKWWSPDKTQADLIRPLLAAGFAVIDRTVEKQGLAGLFYAVRLSRADPRSPWSGAE